MEKQKRKTLAKTDECIRAYNSAGNSSDVLGSYTGVPRGAGHQSLGIYLPYDESLLLEEIDALKPEQDADDL